MEDKEVMVNYRREKRIMYLILQSFNVTVFTRISENIFRVFPPGKTHSGLRGTMILHDNFIRLKPVIKNTHRRMQTIPAPNSFVPVFVS